LPDLDLGLDGREEQNAGQGPADPIAGANRPRQLCGRRDVTTTAGAAAPSFQIESVSVLKSLILSIIPSEILQFSGIVPAPR
jgi:hypothetical protein